MAAPELSEPKKIEITSEMVVAGVKRLRETLYESEESSADAVVVSEILETALSARRGARRSLLAPPLKQKNLTDSQLRLEGR